MEPMSVSECAILLIFYYIHVFLDIYFGSREGVSMACSQSEELIIWRNLNGNVICL